MGLVFWLMTANPAPSTFDLLHRPWIPVSRVDNSQATVGLLELFANAHTYAAITADTPQQVIALHRLCLAILHRSIGPATTAERDRLIADATLPHQIADYLGGYQSRFDLLSDKDPFYQCIQLAAHKPQTPALLYPHMASGGNVVLFDHTTDADAPVLDAGQAARALVALQAFDLGGMKTPGIESTAAWARSSVHAPCAVSGMFLALGGTLKETLLLNADVYEETGTTGDLAAWEKPSPGVTRGSQEPDLEPHGWVNLLTWQARRTLLFWGARDNEPVATGVVVCPGDRLNKVSASQVERMAAWPPPDPSQKKDEDPQPVRLSQAEAIWRQSAVITSDRSRLAAYRNAGPGEILRMMIVGQVASQAKMIAVCQETLTLPASIRSDPARQEALEDAMEWTAEAARAVRKACYVMHLTNRTPDEMKSDLKKQPFQARLGALQVHLTPGYNRLMRDLANPRVSAADALERYLAAIRIAIGKAENALTAPGKTLGSPVELLRSASKATGILRAFSARVRDGRLNEDPGDN